MKTDLKRLKLGGTLFLALAILNSCRTSRPPAIEICILDGVGAAECIERDGTRKVRLPSELKNYWATNQDDMKAYASWCHDTSRDVIELVMRDIELKAKNLK